jgi:hypothetical protein
MSMATVGKCRLIKWLRMPNFVVHGGVLVARGKENVLGNSLYSNTRSSPYYSLATPLLPVCAFSGC